MKNVIYLPTEHTIGDVAVRVTTTSFSRLRARTQEQK
jgi:hypothetical protein